MSFSIGASSPRMGPRGAMDRFGEKVEGRTFNLRVILRLLAYLRPYWRRMAVALLLMLIATVLTLVTPSLVKVAIDQPIAQGRSALLFASIAAAHDVWLRCSIRCEASSQKSPSLSGRA